MPETRLHHDKQIEQGNKKVKLAAHFYSLRKYYERDSAYLGLIESFIQDGPQLILQLYILAIRDSHGASLYFNESKSVAVIGT